jgi:hypothetical protein
VESVTGNVTVQTFATVTGNTAHPGSDGIQVISTSGNVLVHTYAPVFGDPAIIVSTAGNVDVITDAASPTTGTTVGISGTSTGGAATHVNVDVSAAVTGQAGDGIFTSSAGGPSTVTVRQGVTATGTGAGNSGINANTTSGAILVDIAGQAGVTNATGRGVTLNTGSTGTATLNNGGSVFGLGALANPTIFFANNNNTAAGSAITINNGLGATMTNAGGKDGWAVTPGTAAPSTSMQPIIINNAGSFAGRIILGAGDDMFNNSGVWNLRGISSVPAAIRSSMLSSAPSTPPIPTSTSAPPAPPRPTGSSTMACSMPQAQ